MSRGRQRRVAIFYRAVHGLTRRAADALRESRDRHDHPRDGLPEDKAVAIASEEVHQVREEMAHEREEDGELLSAPSPEEVRRRREERRKREAS